MYDFLESNDLHLAISCFRQGARYGLVHVLAELLQQLITHLNLNKRSAEIRWAPLGLDVCVLCKGCVLGKVNGSLGE